MDEGSGIIFALETLQENLDEIRVERRVEPEKLNRRRGNNKTGFCREMPGTSPKKLGGVSRVGLSESSRRMDGPPGSESSVRVDLPGRLPPARPASEQPRQTIWTEGGRERGGRSALAAPAARARRPSPSHQAALAATSTFAVAKRHRHLRSLRPPVTSSCSDTPERSLRPPPGSCAWG